VLSLAIAVSVGVLVIRNGQPPEPPGAFGASRPADTPTPGFEEADGPLGVVLPPPANSSYRFSAMQEDGNTPVTYDPCRPVHYVTRPDGGPAGGDALIGAAVAQVSAATGLRFVNDGHTTESPSGDRASFQPDRYGDRWAPVLILWETASEQPDFGVDVTGLGGSTRVGGGDHPASYVTGMIQLDASKLGAALSQPDGRQRVQNVILHELGHLVGLAHVNDPQQLMYPRGGTVNGFGPGDLTGLARLGAGACASWL
jgi:hypothetical protein